MTEVKSITPNETANFASQMGDYKSLQHFRYWCYKTLPLVYDDSLSYYEILCKVVNYINNLIDNDKIISSELETLKNEVTIVKQWIDNFNAGKIVELEKIVGEYLKVAVLFGLTDSGYFVAYIPSTWDDITFGTTGLDTPLSEDGVYGRLTLNY